jgi:acyl-CoA synthetase (NDP forming)/GNAT superfamily N-acetyltransferase
MPLYPAHWEADVVLRDGRTAHLRPVTPDDAPAVVSFYAGVSEQSKFNRFFAPYPELSPRDVDRLTTVDYDSSVVLVALLRDAIIGLVQYERLSPTEADVAFLVQDAHQGRGLASVLLEHLAEVARERGIHRFTADVLPSNRHMLAVFRAAGYSVDSRTEDGVVSLSFGVDPTEASRAVTQEREHRAEARSVARLLAPRSVAVAGASRTGRGVGSATLRHLAEAGFTGDLYAVHPEAADVCGIPAYPRFQDIPGGADLAVIAVPSEAVADVVADAAAGGARALVVISEGFAETGTVDGRAKQRELVRLARLHGMRLLGPNALGLLNTDPAVRLNASLSPQLPPHGRTAFFAQSGALGITLLENVARRGLGISSFVSAGNRADISGNDMLQYWQDDPGTAAVMLYLESIGNPRKFSRLARRVGHVKPVVAVRSTGATQGVPLGHTVRQTAVPQAAIEAMYEQAGVIGVDTIHEMFDVAQLLARQPVPAGTGVAIVGNSDPLSLLAAAACTRYGLVPVAERVSLRSTATGAELAAALDVAAANPAVHSIVVTVARRTDGSVADHVAAVAAAGARGAQTVVATYVGLRAFAGSADVDGGVLDSVPTYPTPEDAVRALAAVTAYGEWRRRPDVGEPALDDIDPDAAADLIDEALLGRPEGIDLDRASLGALLGLYGVPLQQVTAGSPAAVEGSAPGASVTTPGRRVVIRTREDALFGPMVCFGLAGIASDVLGDVGYRIPPLTELDARELVLSVRAAPLLTGEGGRPPLDLDGLVGLLVRLGRLAYDVPHVAELEVTAIAEVDGVRVVDASCHLQRSAARVDRSARSLPAGEGPDPAADGSSAVGAGAG